MVTFLAILTALPSLMSLWDKISVVLKMFQTTPVEQHDALIKAIEAESEKLKTEGRPTWS